MNKEIKRIKLVLFLICLMFLSLVLYLTYFQGFKADKISQNSYNKRLWINEEKTRRGNIEDRNGLVLAHSEKDEDRYRRVYNFENLYSHIIGYSYREFGKSGLELNYNNTLLNISENLSINEIKNLVDSSGTGNNLRLTIDHEIQKYTREKLEGRKGAIVVSNPKTGEIYSMVSLPDFNPAKLKDNWGSIMENPDSPFINRATSGLYPPGSSFKLVTSLGILENPAIDQNFSCQGSVLVDGYNLKDYSGKAHGDIDLAQALTKSCNTYFASKSQDLGKDNFYKLLSRAYIGKEIDFDLPTKASRIEEKSKMGKTSLAAASIGQGKLLVSPLNMNLITAAIANDGVMMKPILVKNVISPRNNVIKTNNPLPMSTLTDKDLANELKDMMVSVVNNGTGKNAQLGNIQVAGKTGTAENASGKSHAWFTGFAPAEDPQVVVTVILEEDASTGGKTAAPIARDIIKSVMEKHN